MLWIKALHIIGVVCWFAGLFYLPRLFVYHAMSEDAVSRERFQIMERKLYRGIMMPSMLFTLVFGGLLLFMNWPAYQKAAWMHAKLLLVFFLIGYHHICGAFVRKFVQGDKCVPFQNPRSHVFFRWFNEVPVVMLILIVVLVEVQSF